ncbi:MAG: sigma-70 family RNA polymerase sigma factor [Gemmataceae bacterium]|nr:sigma-70 family RNA polymerase sigma factor [Gemmataceae bacterium]
MAASSATPADFRVLLERALARDEVAARQLYELYGPHVRQVVRKRLHPRLRTMFDSLDFVHDVWGWLLEADVAKYELSSPQALVNLLTRIARRKLANAERSRRLPGAAAIPRELSLEEVLGDREIAAQQDTPSRIVMNEEAWQRFLAEQPPLWREILILTRQGHGTASVAKLLGLHQRTVQRILYNLLT